MSQIEVKKIIKALNASDGAGVKLKRSIGTPEADYIDPFLMLDEFGSENKDDYVAGFPPHPHRGIETVTYMLNGEFEHQDSTGAKGIMSSGDVQWMKTGRGIIHSEMPAMKEGKLLGFQLWINMPAKMKKNKPEYLYIKGNELGQHEDSEKIVKVIAGKYEKAAREELQKQALDILTTVRPAFSGDLTVRAKVTETEIGTVAGAFFYFITRRKYPLSGVFFLFNSFR